MRLRYQFELIQLIRNYFGQQGFLDVLTPPAVENPGMEVHIHPFQLHSVSKRQLVPLYLHTSPEFALKQLLASSDGFDRIFSIGYCFRDEPSSPIHRNQFVMLEWYRKHARYEAIMDDVEGLIDYCRANLTAPARKELVGASFTRMTMAQLFQEVLGVNILDHLDVPSIKGLLRQFPDVPVPTAELEWDDYFFLLFLNKVEPELKRWPLLLISEFPAPLSALATLKASDPRVCERFEVYVNGVELCNCFNELTDATEQRRRFDEQARLKRRLYGYELPPPKAFYSTLDQGFPNSAGIALGVERLLQAFFEVDDAFFAST